MGRKNYADPNSVKTGPGRKARKQPNPNFDGFIDNEGDFLQENLTRRQIAYAKKRALKEEEKYKKKLKVGKNPKDKKPAKREDSDDEEGLFFTKPVTKDKLSKDKQPAKCEDSNDEEGLFFTKPVTEDKLSEDEVEESGDDKEEESDFKEESIGSSNEEDEYSDLEEQSKALERRQKRVELASELEMQDTAHKSAIEIPSLDEVLKEIKENPDIQVISNRLKNVVFILQNFKQRRDVSRSKSEYLSILEADLCAFYSYNEFLMHKLIEQFPLSDLIDFLEANEAPRPVTIRTNTLKTTRNNLSEALIHQGVNLDIINWSKVGCIIYSSGSLSIGATPEYLAGHYILQGASSFLPIVALKPELNENILDMCSAPGGKATHIAALMKNSGCLVANDIKKDRLKALIGNFHRMGVTNSIISHFDGRKIPFILPNFFDRALLDAPCTGTGVISKDDRVKLSKDEISLQRCVTLQKELLLAAIDSVNAKSSTGGIICYSTCSVLIEENEDIINFALNKRDVKLVETGLEIGKEGFTKMREKRYHPSMSLCRRVYPHTNNMDGFFVAKLKKKLNATTTNKNHHKGFNKLK